MSNDSGRDEIPNNDQIPQAATILGEETLTTGEQSAATPGTRAVNETLQHFHTALVNLVNEANKIGLTLPIGLGASSPYELTASAPGNHSTGRLRSEVHVATPNTQAKPSSEETPQDSPKALDEKRAKEGKKSTGRRFPRKTVSWAST